MSFSGESMLEMKIIQTRKFHTIYIYLLNMQAFIKVKQKAGVSDICMGGQYDASLVLQHEPHSWDTPVV
jgi:hypothetical protein